jgi:hypothetical protein
MMLSDSSMVIEGKIVAMTFNTGPGWGSWVAPVVAAQGARSVATAIIAILNSRLVFMRPLSTYGDAIAVNCMSPL